MIDNRTYAICAALFFSIMAWGLITFGGNEVKLWAFMSLMFGGLSQFFAQGREKMAFYTAVFCSYMGMLFMVVAVWRFWFTSTL